MDRAPVECRRAIDGRGEHLVPCRVEDDPDGRHAIDDQPDRDAEDRQAVGVVHGPVERIDDPDPATPRGGRLARLRLVLPGLLGKDRVGRVVGPDRIEDQRLGQVVGLGHDVPGALVVDLLEPLVVVHQHDPGPDREIEREAGARPRTAVDAEAAGGAVAVAVDLTGSCTRPPADGRWSRARSVAG